MVGEPLLDTYSSFVFVHPIAVVCLQEGTTVGIIVLQYQNYQFNHILSYCSNGCRLPTFTSPPPPS